MSASEHASRMTPERQSEVRAILLQAAGSLARKICPSLPPVEDMLRSRPRPEPLPDSLAPVHES